MEQEMILSRLSKTWIFDLDGTLVKHNGYKSDGIDTLLPGVLDFFMKIPENDKIFIMTSRKEKFREMTCEFLKKANIRYDAIFFDMPYGERLVINDRKPSGINMAVAVNIDRDEFEMPKIQCIN